MGERVLYWIPSDQDDMLSPNEFYVRAGGADGVLRLGEIRAAFPLEGRYHFRFKTAYKKSYVWKDLCRANAQAPRFEGAIFAKVARLALRAVSSSSTGAAAPAPAARASARPRTQRQKAASAATARESSDLLNLLAEPSDSPERSRRLSRRKSAEFKSLHSELLGQTAARRPSDDGSRSASSRSGLGLASLDLAAMGDIFASGAPQAGAVEVLLSPPRALSAPGTVSTSPRGQHSDQRRRSSLSSTPRARRKSGATNLFESLGGI